MCHTEKYDTLWRFCDCCKEGMLIFGMKSGWDWDTASTPSPASIVKPVGDILKGKSG